MMDAPMTTPRALDMVAYERAPRHEGGRVNRRIICGDGYRVSVQASGGHYADDSDGGTPYWTDEPTHYPFVTFEIGNPSDKPSPAKVWDEYDSCGVWAFVPRQVVADLLDLHGGATGWEQPA